jgi:hypothetical protein
MPIDSQMAVARGRLELPLKTFTLVLMDLSVRASAKKRARERLPGGKERRLYQRPPLGQVEFRNAKSA